jgi:hypothetical protein
MTLTLLRTYSQAHNQRTGAPAQKTHAQLGIAGSDNTLVTCETQRTDRSSGVRHTDGKCAEWKWRTAGCYAREWRD